MLGGWFLFLFASFHIAFAADDEKLELVQILFRHGDRTPIDPFPTDPWRNHWSEGYGQLTKIGKLQQYNLGMYFRLRYDGFLNDTYNCNEIIIKSSDVDRTLMSAYCNLAGLFPPNDAQKWDVGLDWQPIPVHTRPNDIDWLLKPDATCPKYDQILQEVKSSPEMQKINEANKDLFNLLTNKTGKLVEDIFVTSNIYDVLLIEQKHNLTVPDWATASLLSRMKHLSDEGFVWSYKTHELRRLRGGPLVGEMVNNMQNKISNPNSTMKMHMYSAHDTTVAAFLNALNIFNNKSPPYFATVMVELYKKENIYSVKMFYRNSSASPYELLLPGCSSPCPFSLFKSITEAVIPADIQKECSEVVVPNIALISAVLGSIVGCSLLLITVGGVMYWRRSNNSYRYLTTQAE